MDFEDTIGRILKEKSFKNPETRITKKTVQLTTHYINLFINEAILRSNEERIAEGNSLTRVDGIDNIPEMNTQNDEFEFSDDDNDPDVEDVDPELDDMQQSSTQRQLSGHLEEITGNDTLDSRHLSKIAGVLLMDF